jgi:hypothetical protein
VDLSDIPKREQLKARRENMTENDPILDVYERFKHLDRQISEAGQGEDPFHKTCAALWVAVKKHRAQVKKEKTISLSRSPMSSESGSGSTSMGGAAGVENRYSIIRFIADYIDPRPRKNRRTGLKPSTQ